MTGSLLVLTSSDVARVTSEISPDDLINLMAFVFSSLSLRSGLSSPHRTSVSTEKHNILFMPSRITGLGTSIKVVGVPTSPSDTRGIPGSTVVLDEDSGVVKAIVNARKLTALRNAAGSLLATKVALSPRSAGPEIMVMFGAGAQIEAHAALFAGVYRGSLRKCFIFNRTANSRLEDLIAALGNEFSSVQFVGFSTGENGLGEEHKEVVESADIICAATSSSRPLFPGDFVKPGAHINLIGSYKPTMIEVDSTLIHRAGKILVDSVESCLVEAGDLISAGVGRDGMVELGELLQNTAPGAPFTIVEEKCTEFRGKGDVTIFKSVGVGVQDVAIASLVVRIAESLGVGSRVNAYDT